MPFLAASYNQNLQNALALSQVAWAELLAGRCHIIQVHLPPHPQSRRPHYDAAPRRQIPGLKTMFRVQEFYLTIR